MSGGSLRRPLRIGTASIPGNLFLAPVAGFSDPAFRSVCVDCGADFCYTEMVSAEALTRDSAKTASLLPRAFNEKAYAVQLFGSKAETMAKAAAIASAYGPAVIDVNCGCPVPKILKSGAGCALMKNPPVITKILNAMRAETDIPITVKFRLGWDDSSVNFLEFAECAQKGGASALCLHARTKAQNYSGKADWARIGELKRDASVPVLGSGDLFSPESAKELLETSGCDGLMFARGAIGHPFIFRQTAQLLEKGGFQEPLISERVDAARSHLERAIALFGEQSACLEFRKHFCAYTKGIDHGAVLRRAGVQASSQADFNALFEGMLTGYGAE
jgi:nifR3 family TIM-barrel protein